MLSVPERIERIRQRVTTDPRFLQTRIDAENEARRLLDARTGSFTREELEGFLDLCNTELVPPKDSDVLRDQPTRTRFQLSFIGENRMLMLERPDECNRWISAIWKQKDDQLSILDTLWRSGGLKGAGTGFPTMLFYLKRPERYSVWLPGLSEALSSAWDQVLGNRRTALNYSSYNAAVARCLRIPFGVEPQEIDYILYCLAKPRPAAQV